MCSLQHLLLFLLNRVLRALRGRFLVRLSCTLHDLKHDVADRFANLQAHLRHRPVPVHVGAIIFQLRGPLQLLRRVLIKLRYFPCVAFPRTDSPNTRSPCFFPAIASARICAPSSLRVLGYSSSSSSSSSLLFFFFFFFFSSSSSSSSIVPPSSRVCVHALVAPHQ